MRLRAPSGRGRLANSPRRFEIYVLIVHVFLADFDAKLLRMFSMVAVGSRSGYGAVAIATALEMHSYIIEWNQAARCINVSLYCARWYADWLRLRIEPLARSHRLESPDRGISISPTFRRRSDWRRLTVMVIAATRFNCCRDGINRLHNRKRNRNAFRRR
jgi:hypothetical protein